MVIKPDGSVQGVEKYKAFGEVRYPESPADLMTDHRYTGQLEIGFGLYHYGARVYDPYLNRFLSPDSIVPEASQGAQARDRYAYVNNSPLAYKDPSGHCIGPLIIVCLLGAVVLITAAAQQMELGALEMNNAAQNSSFTNEQKALQVWQNNCMGQCHYAEATSPVSNISTGNKPNSPSSDQFSEGLSDVFIGAQGVVAGVVTLSSFGPVYPPRESAQYGYGGKYLNPEEEIVMFESQKGSGKIKTFDPLGNSAQSLRVAGSPEEAHYSAFGRPPKPGDPYWQTNAGRIGARQEVFPILIRRAVPDMLVYMAEILHLGIRWNSYKFGILYASNENFLRRKDVSTSPCISSRF